MYCSKCGAKLPNDSVFCTDCGNQVDMKISSKEDTMKKRFLLKRLATNKKYNICAIILCAIIFVLGFNMQKKCLHEIDYNSKLIQITQKIVELKETSPVLGSSYSDVQELNKYKSEKNKNIFLVVLGIIFIVISVFTIVYMIYNLILILKKGRE